MRFNNSRKYRALMVSLSSVFLLMSSPNSYAKNCERAEGVYQNAVSTSDVAIRIELLQESRQECENFPVLYELGKANLKNDNLEEAKKWFKKASSLPEANEQQIGKSFVALGGIAEKQGEATNAIVLFKQALRLYDFPKLPQHVMQLELKKVENGYQRNEIVSALEKNRAFGVEAGLNLPVQFEYNKTELNKAGREQAAQLGEALLDEQFEEAVFVLLGHTDSRGTAEYNMQLSKDRAASVKQFLTLNYPIEPHRIRIEGYGENRLLYSGDSEDVHKLNRRVEVRIE